MNPRTDCAAADRWDMASGAPFAQALTASAVVTNSTLGTVALDVTSDVAAGFAQHGWTLTKEDENRQGMVGIGSRESVAGARLVMRYVAH